ncbi:hypothetical protein COOONC_16266 [Cooperia oncophora]
MESHVEQSYLNGFAGTFATSSMDEQMYIRRCLRWQEKELRYLCVLHINSSHSGSKGVSNNGKEVHSFLPNECEEEMTHCFESYSDDMSQITASCQSMNTEQRLLDVYLCNLPPEEKKKVEEQVDNSEDKESESIDEDDRNSTLHGEEEELLPITLDELLKLNYHHNCIRHRTLYRNYAHIQ